MKFSRLTALSLPALGLLALCLPVAAAELGKPEGKVILEVTGLIGNTNNGKAAEFDLAMLDALTQGTITTTTPWYDSARTFTGPTGAALLDALAANGTVLRVLALNDYITEIPVSDLRDDGVVFATRLDGATMSVREKGPIFVIYPFDAHPELKNETIYGRSAWQVKSIEVK